jgi:curli biogenesis system outer membrane secretion channel CsgG
MNQLSASMILLFALMVSSAQAASKKESPRVSIQEIQNKAARSTDSARCDYGYLWSTPGEAMRELLTDELSKLGGIDLLERENIENIYQQEIKHENLNRSSTVKQKKFLGAKYAIAGTLSEFEWCMSSSGGSVNIGGLLGIGDLELGSKQSKAHVAATLRLIDVETGKIIKTVNSEGQADESGLTFSGAFAGNSLNLESFNRTPLGKATRTAMAEAATKLQAAILSAN